MSPVLNKPMLTGTLLIFSTLLFAQDAGVLNVNADVPNVAVSARPAGRDFISLPTLRYVFEITQRCRSGFEPASLSLSVADTRRSVTPDALSAPAPIALEMTIPAGQIGPIAIADFCVAQADAAVLTQGPVETLRIPAVLSLQAALLCAAETDSHMLYASSSLDVTLNCGPSEEASASQE